MLGLYIHIPFCKRKCFYCDFVSVAYNSDLADRYIQALIKEIQQYKDVSIDTIYIGGGTPSVLSLPQMEQLISNIKSKFDISHLKEFTIELNPESTTKEKLDFLYRSGITRISFGLQTTFDGQLQVLGRLHTFDVFNVAYSNAKKAGFENINADLMYGIPNQTLKEWEEILMLTVRLGLSHISLYPLTVEPGTVFFVNKVQPDTDLQCEMYNIACLMLKNSGFEHYEISNWAKNDKYSKHNKLYWQNMEYIGLGASASSYYKRYRYKNIPNINKYIENVFTDVNYIIEKEYINDDLYKKENIMLGLRLSDGIDIKYFADKKDTLDKYIKENMMTVKDNRVILTEKALFVSNSIISDFI